MEESSQDESVRMVRQEIPIQACETDNLRTELWKQSFVEQTLDWWHEEPPGVPRVATGVENRVGRLKALGNGQVPLCAATAWKLLTTNAAEGRAK